MRRHLRLANAAGIRSRVAGLNTTATLLKRAGVMKKVVSPSKIRSNGVRFGARCRERLAMRS